MKNRDVEAARFRLNGNQEPPRILVNESNVSVRMHLRLVNPELDSASTGRISAGGNHPKGPATLRGRLSTTAFLNANKGKTPLSKSCSSCMQQLLMPATAS